MSAAEPPRGANSAPEGGSAAREPDGPPRGRTPECEARSAWGDHSSAERDSIDPRIDALLRDHATQGPPAHVDAAILAAAHRAVGSQPRRIGSPLAGRPLRWWMPLAAAAVVGAVVIGILPLAPTAPQPSPVIVDDAPAPARRDAPVERERESASEAPPEFAAPPSNAPAKPASAAPIVGAPAPKRDRAQLSMQKQQKVDSIVTEPRASTADEPPVAQKDAAAAANKTAPHSPAPQASAAGAMAESTDSGARRASADWIARIRALRNAGNVAEARAELTRFRAAFDDADARLPADMRAWAAALR